MRGIKYILVVNGAIRFMFWENEEQELIEAYKEYKFFYSDVEMHEINYIPEAHSFVTKKLAIKLKVTSKYGKDRE